MSQSYRIMLEVNSTVESQILRCVDQSHRIATLIKRLMMQTITPEEKDELDEWIVQGNEGVFGVVSSK